MAPTFLPPEAAFQVLTDKGYPKEAVCLELYYSGELGAVRSMMGRDGLRVFKMHLQRVNMEYLQVENYYGDKI